MAKNHFKFRLKITGFELEVEGSKEEVAAITSTVTNQIKALSNSQVIGLSNEIEDTDVTELSSTIPLSPQRKRSNRKSASSTGSNRSQKVDPIDFKNDPKKYSAPSMSWKTQEKSLWILYVLNEEKQISELSTQQICNTFNAHFKQAKTINSANIARDLGKSKLGNSAYVGENTSSSPNKWYLTEVGIAFVQNLIKDSRK